MDLVFDFLYGCHLLLQLMYEICTKQKFFAKHKKRAYRSKPFKYMVATPRIELGTQGFSIPCSTN